MTLVHNDIYIAIEKIVTRSWRGVVINFDINQQCERGIFFPIMRRIQSDRLQILHIR